MFGSEKELTDYLKRHNIPIETWGKGEAKSLASLLKELQKGEAILMEENGQLLRQLYVAVAYVFFILGDNKLLRVRETKQEFLARGETRTRQFIYPSVAEKLMVGEEPMGAMERALRDEELQITGQLQITYVGGGSETKNSQSFPGLPTRYIFSRFFVQLSPDQYNPKGYVEDQSDDPYDPKKTYFDWKEA